MKSSKPLDKRPPTTSALSAAPEERAFAEVVEMTQAARGRIAGAGGGVEMNKPVVIWVFEWR